MEGTSGLERYGETLTPTLDLWDLPEWAYLRREVLFGWEGSPAAVAGEFSGAALVNPAGSGTIVVVERIHAHAGATFATYLSYVTEAVVTATFAAGALPVLRDSRNLNVPGRARFFTGSDPGFLATRQLENIFVAANTLTPFSTGLPFVLTPGYGLVVQAGAVNNAFAVSFGYRERTAFPGELE